MKRTHSLPCLLSVVAVAGFATTAAAQTSQGVVKASATITGCTDASISGRALLVERPTSGRLVHPLSRICRGEQSRVAQDR